MYRIVNQLRAVAALLRSFVKKDWDLDDYPIRVFYRGSASDDLSERLKPYTWTAQVINWWHMRGDGFTRDEAIDDLKRKFQERKAEHARLPRPGRGAPLEIKFAPTDQIELYREIADDLLARVIGMNPSECFISDESSLWDFHTEETNEPYIRKIALLYGVDVAGIEPPTITAICRKIDEARRA
jgi:hypothetical protein